MLEQQLPQFLSWILWIFLFSSSCLVSIRLARIIPFIKSEKSAFLPIFFGAALSPFYLGFSAILALKIFPQATHLTHLVFICFSLFTGFIISLFIKANLSTSSKITSKYSPVERLSIFLISVFSLLSTYSTLSSGLYQADALEYAQIGRIIFDNRSLDNYPPIIPDNHPSGFYAQITHPPLYAALIYTAYLTQGDTVHTKIMQSISLLFALLSMGLVFAIGNQINLPTAIFSSLFFISTPLLFMGATRALIDTVPVLGFCLVMASVVLFEAKTYKSWLAQGIILGISLWTHSQALLFPPLMVAGLVFYRGLANWKELIKQISVIALIAVTTGIWQYLDNYNKIGSFISDKPPIFQLQNLHWEDYFLIGRGVDGLTAQIQYGFFKGWFALEAYSILFWIVAAGVFLLKSPPLKKVVDYILGCKDAASEGKILLAMLAVILAYHAGIFLAILLGINQIFRIERYMLIIVLCMSLIAGYVLDNCFHYGEKIKIRRLFASVVILLIAVQAVVFSTQSNIFSASGNNQVVSYIRRYTPEESVILATLVGDMYYADRKTVSNMDPRMEEFYKASSAENGWEILRKFGITHIYVTPNAQPTFYNSYLQTIVSDPSYSRLLYNADGYQLYQLNLSQEIPSYLYNVDLLSEDWNAKTYLLIGGRKSLARIPLFSHKINGELQSKAALLFLLFQRDFTTSLQLENKIRVNRNVEHQVKFSLSGYGLLRLWLTEYDDNKLIKKTMLSETILSKNYSHRDFSYRFITLPNTEYITMEIEHYGNSSLAVEKAQLVFENQPVDSKNN